MTVDDVSGTVTICKRGLLGLYADDHGLIVRNADFRTRRYAWAEVSRLADGSSRKQDDSWVLHIEVRTGRAVPVDCTTAISPSPETLAVIREVAARHGIPAHVLGVPTKDERPAVRGLYHDPGGQPGLRYWDGSQWSPLLPPDFKPAWARTVVRDSPGSWSALPTAVAGRWRYAAARAKWAAAWCAGWVIVEVSILAWIALTQALSVSEWFGLTGGAAWFALIGWGMWVDRKYFLRLDEAANAANR